MPFTSDELGLDQLVLDDANPRLPEHLLGASQVDILRWMYDTAVLEELAASFLEHGYLEAEPLFVLPLQDGLWAVLEGNRRLASLMVLTQHPTAVEAELKFRLQADPSMDQLDRLSVVPVRVTNDREEVREYVGFRHIGGIKEWPAEAKARWIEDEIHRRGGDQTNVFADIGRSVGTNAQSVRGPYLALRILRHALNEAQEVLNAVRFIQEHRFGVLVRATNSPDLRLFLSPDSSKNLRTMEDVDALVEGIETERLLRVLSDMVPPPGKRSAVLSDSRDVTTYARALQHPVAEKALQDYGDLSLAKQILDRQNMPERIRSLEASVRVVLDEIQRDLEPPPEGSHDASRGLLSAAQSLEVQLAPRNPSSH